jgi:type II secretory pathway pseudopilin PulG
MTIKQRKFASAVSLVEVIVATVIFSVVTIGALSYQYHAAKDAQIAHAQITATCTAQLLLEDWKSTGGSQSYDPAKLGMGFSTASAIPADFDQEEGLGSALNEAVYAITIDEMPMLVMLTKKDVAQDTGGVILRQIGVIVEFGTLSDDTDAGWLETIPPVVLGTYVRADAAGG